MPNAIPSPESQEVLQRIKKSQAIEGEKPSGTISLRVASRLLHSDSPLTTLRSALSPSQERRRLSLRHRHDGAGKRALFSYPKKGKYT